MEQERKKPERLVDKTLKKFIRDLEITAGETQVPNTLIFYAYIEEWKGVPYGQKVSRIEFFRQWQTLFQSYRKGFTRGYMLNNVFDMSKDHRLKARISPRNGNKNV